MKKAAAPPPKKDKKAPKGAKPRWQEIADSMSKGKC